MVKRSAGLLLYRMVNGSLEIFLVHPGGPFYSKKDVGVWSIPKGEFDMEDPLVAARREFREETGFDITGDFVELRPIKQKSGKLIYAWAVEADVDATRSVSNMFALEWPPRSGKIVDFPEVDQAEWFSVEAAREKILPAQTVLIDDLLTKL